MIDDTQYAMVQQHLLLIAQIVDDMPLDEFVKRIARADAVGPILDPTLYRDAHRNLELIRELAVRLYAFQTVAKKLREAVHADPAGK